MITDDDFLRIGVITGVHGLQGRLKVYIITDFPERFSAGNTVVVDENGFRTHFLVQEFQEYRQKTGLLKLQGVDTRDSAEKMKKAEILISKTHAEEARDSLDEDSFFYHEIIGSLVYIDERLFGTVIDILEAGSGDILIILDENEKQHMVPFVQDMVDTASLSEGRIFVHPIEGLLDF